MASNDVEPGVLGFLVVAGIGVALVFLFRSMNKQFRKIAPAPDAADGEQAGDAAKDRGESPEIAARRVAARNVSPHVAWQTMRVIHGIWAQGRCACGPRTRASGRAARPGPPAPHPFACQAAELADLLAALPGPAGEAARKAVDDELTLQLPSAAGPARPLASSAHPPGRAGAPARPGPAGQLAGAGAGLHPGRRAGPARLGDLGELAIPGASLPYLAALARFADGLAARGRVLPVLIAEDGGYAARWRPVLGGADAQRARDLAAAMPASCRAVAGDPPGVLLAAALDGLADAAARTRLPGSLLPARRGRTPAHIPLAERYVASLTSTDARLDVVTPRDEAEAAELAAELDAWLEGALIPAGPVRTCFRLTEPAVPEEDPWRVEFALQSTEDPSLMVPAVDIWAGDAWAGQGPGGDPVEELLAGLGAAARLFGGLEEALRDPAPVMLELDTADAFRFLKETGPLLAGAGFGVLLPDWVRRARLGLKLTTRSQSKRPARRSPRPGSGSATWWTSGTTWRSATR